MSQSRDQKFKRPRDPRPPRGYRPPSAEAEEGEIQSNSRRRTQTPTNVPFQCTPAEHAERKCAELDREIEVEEKRLNEKKERRDAYRNFLNLRKRAYEEFGKAERKGNTNQ